MHCNLYIPDFFSAEGLPPADSLAAAETLIARGRRRRMAPISPEAWLFERFGVPKQRDWPVAPYTLLADGGAPERHYWMRADPVHLRVSRDSLGLADTFEVSRAESEALVETLNPNFDTTVVGDDPLTRGLSLAAGIPARALPKDAGSTLAGLGDEGVALVVLDAPREAQLGERRTALERDWFGPFLAALRSGRIGMLTLHL